MAELTYTFNNDGSLDVPVDGQSVRFVKESDLLAVKGVAEGKAKEWENEKAKSQSDLAEANRLREETHQSLLVAQAAKEQLVTQYSDYDTHKTRVGELETELGSAKEIVGKHEVELTNKMRLNLIARGASEETIKDKTLDQLRNLEEAAKLFGNGNKGGVPARYDGGQGSGGDGVPETPTDRARRILEEHDAKKGKVTV
ncbi:hypothetical protein LCGC14_0527110 [marine sediment metagenome]|uniref:Uncharacterized protein n=1 Tax=marine sediment metagenome TaxID=412755 RepID=A0A0F9SF51_9ZZZZ